MENSQVMHINATTDTTSEVFSLLCDTLGRRPYQAYCVTEASSCPSSPNQFVPNPLRVEKVHSHQIDAVTQALHIDSSEQEDSFDRNVTNSDEKHLNLAGLFTKNEYSKETRQDQIVRLNTIRGGHSSEKGRVTVYDQISLSLQLQPPGYVDGATKYEITRKPMPYNEGSVSINRRCTPRDLDLASQTSHRNSHETSLKNSIPLKGGSKPALYLSPDMQNGPRPPPWGSDDDLALQRRIRSELRERAQILAGGAVLDPTSNYQKLPSTGRLSEGLSREVEEYRQQILSVYPDMTLDGIIGEDKGGCVCCAVM